MGLREERMSNTDANIKRLSADLKEIYEEFIMPVDLNIDLEQVILADENKDKYLRLIKETEYTEKLVEYGLTPINRVLLYGASGTGKTFSTKAVANYLGYTMLYIDIGEALSSGEISKNIKDIFGLADRLRHCIIFLDECDSIAWNREENAGLDASVLRRATNTIFQCLDQMSYENIFFSATNMENKLDPAFVRRFQLKLQFKRPDMNLKDAVRHFLYPKFTLVDDVEAVLANTVEKRTRQNARLSYYEIEDITHRCMKDAVLRDSDEVHTQDVYKEMAKNMNVRIKELNTGTTGKSSAMII